MIDDVPGEIVGVVSLTSVRDAEGVCSAMAETLAPSSLLKPLLAAQAWNAMKVRVPTWKMPGWPGPLRQPGR